MSRRTLIALASLGGAAILAIGFVAFSFFVNKDQPPLAAGNASSTPTTEATVEATPELTASPRPTPKPTPAGPPVELAVGDWATVTTDELQVRTAAGGGQKSKLSLVHGAVLTVAEGPQAVGTENWYRIASLGGTTGWVSSGWVAEPYLETILNDPILIRCGDVADPVFDMVDGVPVAREVLHIGDFVVPSRKFDESVLAAIELARGVRAEVCVTAQVGSDGLPFLRSQPNAFACGHAVADGRAFVLRPAADQEVEVTDKIKDPAIVHPSLLVGPPDNRQSSNMFTLLTMMSRKGAAGCVHTSIHLDSNKVEVSRGARIEQCSIVTKYNDLNIELHPAAGGPTAWIKLPMDNSSRDEIPLNRRIEVYVQTDINGNEIYSSAWSPYVYEHKKC